MLEGKKVKLRALERKDLDRCWRWVNDKEVTVYLGMTFPISKEEEREWFEQQTKDDKNKIFAIEVEGKHIGNCGIHRIDWKNSVAEIGIFIGEKEYWGKGYGTDAVLTLLKFGFLELNLHRMFLYVFDFNKRAMKCYEKCGFKHEGTLRKNYYRNGKYHDTHVMGILREEFLG